MPTLRRRLSESPDRPGVFLIALLAGLAWSVPAVGQGVTAHLGGGVTAPTGYLNTGADLGFQGMAAVSLVPSHFPVSIRLEGMYSHFGFTDDPGHFRVIQGTLNAVYHIPAGQAATIRPYLIAGFGFYNYKSVFSDEFPFDDPANTERGLNGGAGLDFAAGSVRLFTEARYHHVFIDGEDPAFLPITLGVRLGTR